MNLKREKVKELMDFYFQGNYTQFAKALGVDASHLYRFISTGVGGGKKLLGCLMGFCKEKNLNFEDYIEIWKSV